MVETRGRKKLPRGDGWRLIAGGRLSMHTNVDSTVGRVKPQRIMVDFPDALPPIHRSSPEGANRRFHELVQGVIEHLETGRTSRIESPIQIDSDLQHNLRGFIDVLIGDPEIGVFPKVDPSGRTICYVLEGQQREDERARPIVYAFLNEHEAPGAYNGVSLLELTHATDPK